MPTPTLVLLAVLYLVGFSLCHSLLASTRVKDAITRKLGVYAPIYRLFYNLVAMLMMGLFAWFFLPLDRVWYRLPAEGILLARLMQAAGLSLVFWVLFLTFDFREFAGIRQIREWRRRGDSESADLKLGGPYRLCRHPLYLGTALTFACQPVMTVLGAVFAGFVLSYGLLGSIPEERKLVSLYGKAYRDYQKRTRRLIPFLI